MLGLEWTVSWELGFDGLRDGNCKKCGGVFVMGKESVLQMLLLGAIQHVVSVGRRSHRHDEQGVQV